MWIGNSEKEDQTFCKLIPLDYQKPFGTDFKERDDYDEKTFVCTLSYLSYPITRATLEGCNNKTQALTTKAFGRRGKNRLKNKTLCHCGGLEQCPKTGS